MAAPEAVSVTVETDPPSTVRCPVTVQTRVWQLAQLVAAQIGEVPGNVTIVAVGRRLDPLTRVIGVPEQVKFVARVHNKRRTEPFGVDDPKTPRLLPLPKAPEKMKVLVRQEGCAPATVTVSPGDAVNVLRRLVDAGSQDLAMQVGGRSIIDERQSFTDLGLTGECEVHFARDDNRSVVSSRLGIARPSTAAAELAKSYTFLDAESAEAHRSPATARRRYARLVRILFVDPDDDGFTYDLDVWCGRTVSSLLQFVEEEPMYEILCDGRPVEPSATFLEATDGYDGTLFTFVPRSAAIAPKSNNLPPRRDGVPPLSHLTRPYSSPIRSPAAERRTIDRSTRDHPTIVRSPSMRSPSGRRQ